MTHDEQLVEQIVRHVMQRVGAGSPAAQQSGSAAVSASHASRSFFHEAVVTQEVLERRLNGESEINVAPDSILTPSARDFLKSRGVSWTKSQAPASSPKTSLAWQVASLQASDAIEAVLADLEAARGIHRSHEGIECGVAWAVKVLGNAASGAIVLSDEPELCACRANRQRNVRAAVLRSTAELDRINRCLGPNLICIDAGHHSFFELRNLLRAVVSGPPPTVPSNWKEL